MAVEDLTGSNKFIDDFVIANPVGATDTKATLDDHIRGIKNVLKNAFPNLTAAMTVTAAVLNGFAARITTLETFQSSGAATQIQAAIDLAYPVGSIQITTSATNPGGYLVGTWTQIAKGRTIIGEGSGAGLTTRSAGAEIGVEDSVVPSHTHNTDSQGSHTHGYIYSNGVAGVANMISSGGVNVGTGTAINSAGAHTHSALTTGVSPTDKNIQPSLVVYIWERTA